MLGASFYIKRPVLTSAPSTLISFATLLRDKRFIRLFVGIITGTFSGLLIIGNLKHIGLQYPIDYQILVLGITVFSIANFSGRLFWGWLNDFVSGRILIPLSLLLAGIFTLGIGYIQLNAYLYLLLAFFIGFIYAASFVIYANETAQIYGLNNLSRIYPFVFLGYGISGVIGPFTGGLLHDMFGNYQYPALVSSMLCIIVFLILMATDKKNCFT
jgi:OFA family oxalate/formate antiporter-like MFS transporter